MVDPKAILKNKSVLITGGAGFMGSHLCDRLMNYGATVICFDNLLTGSREYIDSHKADPRFSFIFGDANVYADLESVFKSRVVHYVFHYAAVVGVKRTHEKPLEVLNDLESLKHVAALSRVYGVKKIVFASSSEVYGCQDRVPFDEDSSSRDVRSLYAVVKAAGEEYFKVFSGASGMPVTCLRFFNVYGPKQASSEYGFVVPIFISRILHDEPPIVFGDGTQTRDFTFVDDSVDAAIQGLIDSRADGEVLNVGTGIETTLVDLARKIIFISGKNLKPDFMRLQNVLLDAPRRVAGTAKLKEVLEYECTTTLDDGLSKTYEWYRARF